MTGSRAASAATCLVGDQGAPTGQIPLYPGQRRARRRASPAAICMQGFSGRRHHARAGGFDKFEGRPRLRLGLMGKRGPWPVSVDMERAREPSARGGDAIRDFFIDTEAAQRFGLQRLHPGHRRLRATSPVMSSPTSISSTALPIYFPAGPVAFSGGNILLGAVAATDPGRRGNDIIDGDARLHVSLTSARPAARSSATSCMIRTETPTTGLRYRPRQRGQRRYRRVQRHHGELRRRPVGPDAQASDDHPSGSRCRRWRRRCERRHRRRHRSHPQRRASAVRRCHRGD